MLDKLRGHRSSQALKYVIYAALGAIILVFAISFGPGSWGSGAPAAGADRAAVVDGNVISTMELEQAYGSQLDRYRQVTGQQIDAEQARRMGLKRQVLDALIDRELLAEAAQDQGIRVSDQELRDAIVEIPAFHTDGRFDPDLYRRYVSNLLGSSPAQFEARLRKDLLNEKILEALRASVQVSPEEVEARYRADNDKIDVEFVRLSPIQFEKDLEPSDAEVEALLADRADEVRALYDSEQWRFQNPRRVELVQVAVPVAGDEAAARAKAEDLLAKAQAGDDLAEAAQATEGADVTTGWRTADGLPPSLRDVVATLEAGQVAPGVVSGEDALYVVKALNVEAPTVTPFEEVRTDLARRLARREAAEAKAGEAAEALLAQVREGQSLDEAVAAQGEEAQPQLSVSKTGLVPVADGYIPGIGRDAALAERLTSLEGETPALDEVAKVGDSLYVLRVVERQRPDMAAFETEQDSVRERVEGLKQQQVQQAWLQALRDKADIEVNPAVEATTES